MNVPLLDQMLQLIHTWRAMKLNYLSKPLGKERTEQEKVLEAFGPVLIQEMVDLTLEKIYQIEETLYMNHFFWFNLDKKFQIVNLTPGTKVYFSRDVVNLKGMNFKDFIDEESQYNWEKYITNLQNLNLEEEFVELTFLTANNRQVTNTCQIIEVPTGPIRYLVSTREAMHFKPRPKHLWSEYRLLKVLNRSKYDKMPSVAALARKFRVTEYSLRKNFGERFGMTPYQYFIKKRMKIAHTKYVPEKLHPLTKIASLVGYKAYSSFTAAYKKEFGITPSQHRNSVQSGKK